MAHQVTGENAGALGTLQRTALLGHPAILQNAPEVAVQKHAVTGAGEAGNGLDFLVARVD